VNYVKFWATTVGGLAVLGLFSALFGDGLLDVLAGRETPAAAAMLGLGALGLAGLPMIGKHLGRRLPRSGGEIPGR
jgi:hypothetical protein